MAQYSSLHNANDMYCTFSPKHGLAMAVYTLQQRRDGLAQHRWNTESSNNKTQSVGKNSCQLWGCGSSEGEGSEGVIVVKVVVVMVIAHHCERKDYSSKYEVNNFLKPCFSRWTGHDIGKESQEEKAELHSLKEGRGRRRREGGVERGGGRE